MNPTTLTLPQRAVKPRDRGLTMVIDGGLPLGLFTDLIELGARYTDYVKFGWGTSVVTGCLREKIHVLRAHDIGYYFGGYGLVEDVLAAGIPDHQLLFEAPATAIQAHLIARIGPDVNLGNVPAQGVIGTETLRLGLRADTRTAFE